MRKSLCFMRPLLSHLAWLKNLLCYMIHYGTYRGAVVGVRGAAVGNIGIPTYAISRGAVVRQPIQRRDENLPAFCPSALILNERKSSRLAAEKSCDENH